MPQTRFQIPVWNALDAAVEIPGSDGRKDDARAGSGLQNEDHPCEKGEEQGGAPEGMGPGQEHRDRRSERRKQNEHAQYEPDALALGSQIVDRSFAIATTWTA